MPDTYEIRNNGTQGWKLVRRFECCEEGVYHDKYIGIFDTVKGAEKAKRQIETHHDMNYAEWFYPRAQFVDDPKIDQNIMDNHFYGIWRKIGGNLSIDQKRELLTDIATAVAYGCSAYMKGRS